MRLIIGLVIDLVVAFGCASIAGSKGRGRVLWGIFGFLFSLLTLIAVLIVPRKHATA